MVLGREPSSEAEDLEDNIRFKKEWRWGLGLVSGG